MNICTAHQIFEIYELSKNEGNAFELIKGGFFDLLAENKPKEAEEFLVETYEYFNNKRVRNL